MGVFVGVCLVVTFIGALGWWMRGVELAKIISMEITIANMTDELSIVRRERNDAVDELDKVTKERDDYKLEMDNANQSLLEMKKEFSVFIDEREVIFARLEEIAKERNELQAKLCKIKDNDIELLNLKIYKERVLARLKSIIDDEVNESFHS